MSYRIDKKRYGTVVLSRRACRSFRLKTFVVMLLLSFAMQSAAAAGTIRIAAASSLQFALNELVESYRSESVAEDLAPKIQVVYGSSGNLFRQIVQSAPFDLFLSADATLVDKLHSRGVAQNRGVEFGQGQLVLAMSDRIAERFTEESAAGILKLLATDRGSVRLAIANPVHAPYGKAARQFIESLGLWSPLKPALVYGEKVSQATQFVTTGAVDLAVVSLSLALALELEYRSVASQYYQPIVHKIVSLESDKETVADLYQYLSESDTATNVLTKYGYVRGTPSPE